ncbi:hypothetical protein LTR74_017734 [Friedmanniomyces endolithicus]|nr:hypothetical protein LTR74_017734 [Friedmanniomyces endolithicus]
MLVSSAKGSSLSERPETPSNPLSPVPFRRDPDYVHRLEMLLLELPNETALIAQGRKLFFETDRLSSPSADIVLNPVLTKQSVLYCLPIYCDNQNTRLAYCYRAGRRRLYCQSMRISRDQNTGQAWINLDLAEGGLNIMFQHLPEREGVGSWKRMCITQPSCDVMLRAKIKKGNRRTNPMYSGTITAERTLDAALHEGLAQAKPVEE